MAGEEHPEIRIDPRVARSKAAIGEAFLSELAERGFGGLSIEGVAARAGIAKSTIYRHWSNKEEILGSVLDVVWAEARTQLEELPEIETEEDFWVALRLLVASIERMVSDRLWVQVVPSIVDEMLRTADSRALLHSFFESQRTWLARLFQRGAELGLIRDDLSTTSMADALLGSLLFRWILLGEPVPQDALADTETGLLAAFTA